MLVSSKILLLLWELPERFRRLLYSTAKLYPLLTWVRIILRNELCLFLDKLNAKRGGASHSHFQ